MRVLALISAALALVATQGSGHEALKLKSGDTIEVTSPYGGEFKIMSDGAIYGRGFGRLELEGKTYEEALASLRKALHKFVRDDEVNLILKEITHEVVYLVGMNGGKGPVELAPKLSLRRLLSAAPLDENADLVEVQLFRGGSRVCDYNVGKLLSGDLTTPDQLLNGDDVVTLTPVSFVRVWVTGLVAKPGQVKLPAGTTVYQAIGEAGGIKLAELESDFSLQSEGKIVVHRGPEAIELALRQDQNAKAFVLESGDTVSVIAPEERRITVTGEVAKPGEVMMREEHSLNGAIAMAGGPTHEGSLANVLVLRKGELYELNAVAPGGLKTLNPFSLESGDLVFVQRNSRTFLVLGDVGKAGPVLMKDDKHYRLTDALAESDGLSGRGTLRRIFVSHPDATGKVQVAQFNLDEYLKDGKIESNPEIYPGDCIWVGQPRGITIGSVGQFLSGAVLFESMASGVKR